ncbi:hypothetical protein F444_15189 [Phytophthora nicotianae P1976]|uniref:Uncharacterized protein n=1 Tax=Phytophthora nicotianae P1976 TaxID=1317066 RepID=A0A080ZMU4_PHYNI|nr:hypothetical protein F444_15189 [Phytophthora nicotianae P1976]
MTKQLEASCRIAAALDWSCYSGSACLAFGLSFRHVANVSSGDVETLPKASILQCTVSRFGGVKNAPRSTVMIRIISYTVASWKWTDKVNGYTVVIFRPWHHPMKPHFLISCGSDANFE